MQLDINLAEQPLPDDLPDQAENQMFCALRDICRSNVDDGTADGFSRRYDNIIVLCDLERIKWFASCRLVENTHIDGVRDGVVYEFTEDEAVTAFIEELHGVGGNWDAFSYVWVVFQDLLKELDRVTNQEK